MKGFIELKPTYTTEKWENDFYPETTYHNDEPCLVNINHIVKVWFGSIFLISGEQLNTSLKQDEIKQLIEDATEL